MEVLPGETGETVQGGITYKLHHKDTSLGTGYTVTQNDKYDLKGYTYKEGTQNGGNYNNAKFYYVRQKFTLDYNSNNVIVKTTKNIPYQMPLAAYVSYIPDYPTNLESGVYTFEGWCIDPACEKLVDWDTMTMPDANVMVYSKWTPKTHTVRTFLTKDEVATGTPIDTWKDIPHRSVINPAPADPENGNYVFVGWFYEENGVEKAYDFSIAVTKDLDLYAKWSSNTLVEYTIYYKLEDGTVIAAETHGSALAGTTKTFEAKFGDELNEGYKTGYYPKTASHSVTIDINGGNEYTFYYVAKQKVNYTVRYLEVGTEKVLHEEITVETTQNVIDEKFVPISGYRPLQPVIRLILSADEEENVITFWYVKDEINASVIINHYIQTVDGSSYTLYVTETDVARIDSTYTKSPLTNITGYEYNANPQNPLADHPAQASGTVTSSGLELNLFYDRINCKYVIKHVDSVTNEVIETIEDEGRFETQVSGEQKSFEGYLPAEGEPTEKRIVLGTGTNEIIFYYDPCFNVVHVKHESENVIDASSSETVRIKSQGMTYSLTGAVPSGYLYGGAFSDSSCEADKVQTFAEGENAMSFTPVKGSTYYIWEVPERYLVPRSYRVWRHIPGDGRKDVIKLFFLTTIDRNEYGELGFIMDGVDYTSTLDETNDEALMTLRQRTALSMQ